MSLNSIQCHLNLILILLILLFSSLFPIHSADELLKTPLLFTASTTLEPLSSPLIYDISEEGFLLHTQFFAFYSSYALFLLFIKLNSIQVSCVRD